MAYSAEVLLHSLNVDNGCHLYTVKAKYPLIAHPDFLRHRSLSRSVSSNRAIPTKLYLEQVKEDPFIPEYWGRNQSGMQAREELTGGARQTAELWWNWALENAVAAVRQVTEWSEDYFKQSLHKQLANRLLHPFIWVTEVITFTGDALPNLYGLRDHPDAQPELQKIVKMLRQEIEQSKPQELVPGEWHIPYILPEEQEYSLSNRLVTSVARCARTSYNLHGNDPRRSSLAEDWDRYRSLMHSKPKHVSPSEHQALAMPSKKVDVWKATKLVIEPDVLTSEGAYVSEEQRYANLQGWYSFRLMHPGHVIENA